MLNHKDIPLIYDAGSIMDILQGYTSQVITCNTREVEKISKVLNLGLPIKYILYFRLSIGFDGLIHKDINLSNPYFLTKYALNLPLANCEQVYMKWFTQNDSTVNTESFAGPSSSSLTPMLNKNNATCIDTINCNSVKLVNVNDWHSVENHSTEDYAYFISIRFMPNVKPSMDLPMDKWL